LLLYHNLSCVNGNTFNILPKVAHGLPGPIALLLDGPKMQSANRLSVVASTMYDIQVIAHHNCFLGSPWGQEFAKVFPRAFHYEDLDLSSFSEWQEFKSWETEWVRGYEVSDAAHDTVGRSLQTSSLAMASLSPELRSQRRVFKSQGGLSPNTLAWLWFKWSGINLALEILKRVGFQYK